MQFRKSCQYPMHDIHELCLSKQLAIGNVVVVVTYQLLRWLNTVLSVIKYISLAKLWQEKGCSSQAEIWQVKNILMKDFDWQVKCDVFVVSIAT